MQIGNLLLSSRRQLLSTKHFLILTVGHRPLLPNHTPNLIVVLDLSLSTMVLRALSLKIGRFLVRLKAEYPPVR